MPRAVELLKQGRNEELWQMCCGYLKFSLEQFMAVQERLLLEQISLLNQCALGRKVMRGASPQTVAEFRRQVPLTTYADYCPDLPEKREDILPAMTSQWVHTSGKSGEYPCKWVPISQHYANALSTINYGVGMIAGSRYWGDMAGITGCPRIVYTVAPRPYMSGALAAMTQEQAPARYLPPLDESEGMPFQDRLQLGFKQALSQGMDYFFGLSLVLVSVGNRFSQNTEKMSIRPYLSQPRALLRLTRGVIKSKLAGRAMLPRDLWSLKGIMCGGLDSAIYREKIKELWGRYPLDVYGSTEGGVIATQIWDYHGMAFIPNLNFLEFIPEDEHLKSRINPGYQPATVLLDEVQAGKIYEIVITNFHGGAMVRYRIGDMVRIVSLKNEETGMDVPQMAFERRADDLLDFVVIRLTEKRIWQAVENTGFPYEDWTAYKEKGSAVLNMLIEPRNGCYLDEVELAQAIHRQIMKADWDEYSLSQIHDDLADMISFRVRVTQLPTGAFARYTTQKQAEGADLAHLKPPHISPSPEVLSILLSKPRIVPAVSVPADREKVVIS